MHNVVALETNPASETCCANFKNVVSGTGRGPGWGLHGGAGRRRGRGAAGPPG